MNIQAADFHDPKGGLPTMANHRTARAILLRSGDYHVEVRADLCVWARIRHLARPYAPMVSALRKGGNHSAGRL